MKPRDRQHRTERARQERRDLLQKETDRRHRIIESLARRREAWEMARVATQEAALAPSSNDPTTSNPAASAPPSLSAAIDHSATVQPTTPGHASQLTQAEQEEQQDLETQVGSWLPAFDESWADDPVF